jgi:hypothetical protein
MCTSEVGIFLEHVSEYQPASVHIHPSGLVLMKRAFWTAGQIFFLTATTVAGMADDLFNIKNEFFLGNFQGAINEAQASDLVLSSPADEKDRDVIVRSTISVYHITVLVWLDWRMQSLGTLNHSSKP